MSEFKSVTEHERAREKDLANVSQLGSAFPLTPLSSPTHKERNARKTHTSTPSLSLLLCSLPLSASQQIFHRPHALLWSVSFQCFSSSDVHTEKTVACLTVTKLVL